MFLFFIFFALLLCFADLDTPVLTVHQTISDVRGSYYQEKTVFLRCTVNSNPPARFIWKRGNTLIEQSKDNGVDIYEPLYTQVHMNTCTAQTHCQVCSGNMLSVSLQKMALFFPPQNFFFALSLKTEVTLNLSPAFILLTTTISVHTVCFFFLIYEPGWSSMELTQERRGHMKWSACSQNLFSSCNCSEALTLAGVAALSSCECL